MFSILESTLASEDDMADLLAEHMRTVYTHSERYMVQMLNRKAISCRQEFGIDIVARVMIGSPVDKVIEFADANNVDLIVVGNAGLGSLSKIRALGSVSRGVAERASCPVLMSHQGLANCTIKFPTVPHSRWLCFMEQLFPYLRSR